MVKRRFSTGLLRGLLAGVAFAGLLAGCGGDATLRQDRSSAEQPVHQTGYPFRPAPFYNLDDLDELSGPEGYTGGY